MHRNTLLTVSIWLCALAAVTTANAAQVYKTVDKDGNVVFTDVPPKGDAAAERISVTPVNTADLGGIPAATEDNDGDPMDEFAYESVDILSPQDDEAVRGNVGDVPVDIDVYPALQDGHSVRLMLDGVAVLTGRETSYLLTEVERGTHTLALEVIDGDGNLLIASAPTTFHLQRYAIPTAPNQVTPLPGPVTPPVNPPPGARPPSN